MAVLLLQLCAAMVAASDPLCRERRKRETDGRERRSSPPSQPTQTTSLTDQIETGEQQRKTRRIQGEPRVLAKRHNARQRGEEKRRGDEKRSKTRES